MARARGACELCHRTDRPLHVAEFLSFREGRIQGLPESLITSDTNRAAICDEENVGQGGDSVEPLLFAALLRARQIREQEKSSSTPSPDQAA